MKLVLVCLLLVHSIISFAQERKFENGWTSIMHEDFVDYCVNSAVNKNIKYLIDRKVMTVGSEQYVRILKKVKQHQSSVCKCTHNKIMEVYHYNEIPRMMRDKTYIIQIAQECSEKILRSTNKSK